MKNSLIALLTMAALAAHPAQAASSGKADVFEVAVDHAKIMRLSRPATTVIVGNPSIADAAVHDGRLLFITGKTFGQTNFIALDAEGRTILTQNLHVLPGKGQVTLHRASTQRSYVCGEKCEQAPNVGDDADTFQRLMEQQKEKADQGKSAAEED